MLPNSPSASLKKEAIKIKAIFSESSFIGVLVSLSAYWFGLLLKKKFKLAVFNPLLISIVLTIIFLIIFDVDYQTYYSGAKYLSYLLTPATVCLAIPLYEQFELLKKNWFAILLGILSGVITSLCSVFLLALAFKFDHVSYVTFLPKSVTSAIGMAISEELGGYASITVAVIILSGIIGNVMAETICKVFRITDPIAKGVGIGSSSHAIGTARAIEMGEVEGAMSSLSIAVSGVLTVIVAIFFSNLI